MKSLAQLALLLFCGTTQAHTLEEYAKKAASMLTKSGSFATCSLEAREVEDALSAISAQYDGKFTTEVSITPYNEVASAKVCLVLNTKALAVKAVAAETSMVCPAGFFQTSRGCLPQAGCPDGSVFFGGQCVPLKGL